MNFKNFKTNKSSMIVDKSSSILCEAIENLIIKNPKYSVEIEDIPDVEVLEEFDLSSLEVSENLVKHNSLDFVGSFKSAPNPMEQKKNSLYKNLNENKIYIRNSEGLWESFLESGKPGPQGARGPGGSGTGVEEVKSLIFQYSHPEITLKENIVSTTSPATINDLVTFPYNFVPNLLAFQTTGPNDIPYTVSANIYSTKDNITLELIATSIIDNNTNIDGAIFLNTNKYTKFAADIILSSGTLSSGVTVKVVS